MNLLKNIFNWRFWIFWFALEEDGINIPATFFDADDPEEEWRDGAINIQQTEENKLNLAFVSPTGKTFACDLIVFQGSHANALIVEATRVLRQRIYDHYKVLTF